MNWIEFWKWLLVLSLVAYALLALVVTWRGAGDARSMLVALLKRQENSEESQ